MIVFMSNSCVQYFIEYASTFTLPSDNILFTDEYVETDKEQYHLFFNVYNPWLINQYHKKGVKRIGIINTEQLTRPDYFHRYHYQLSQLECNPDLFDYSKFNCEKMAPLHVELVPYGLDKDLIKLDAIMIGTKSDRRQAIVTKLRERGLQVDFLDNLWGKDRDNYIFKTRVLINVHYNDVYKLHESIRCDRWVEAGKVVVSEESIDDHHNELKERIHVCPYDSIVKTVDTIVTEQKKPFLERMKRVQYLREKYNW